MTENMVERVARAIAGCDGVDPDAFIVESWSGNPMVCRQWEACVDDARAAITAMLAPTDGMLDVGAASLFGNAFPETASAYAAWCATLHEEYREEVRADAKAVFSDMISEALK